MTTSTAIKKIIRQRIFAILLLQLGILTLIIAFPYYLSTPQGKVLFHGWHMSKAIVNELDSRPSLTLKKEGSKPRLVIYYTYQVNGEPYEGRVSRENISINPKKGALISIIYDPSQPDQSQTFLGADHVSLFFIIIGLLQILIAIFFITKLRKKTRQPAS